MTLRKLPNMHISWLEALEDEFKKPYMLNLRQFLIQEKSKNKKKEIKNTESSS